MRSLRFCRHVILSARFDCEDSRWPARKLFVSPMLWVNQNPTCWKNSYALQITFDLERISKKDLSVPIRLSRIQITQFIVCVPPINNTFQRVGWSSTSTKFCREQIILNDMLIFDFNANLWNIKFVKHVMIFYLRYGLDNVIKQFSYIESIIPDWNRLRLQSFAVFI